MMRGTGEVEEVLLLTLLNSVGIIEYKSATVSLLSVFLLPFSLHLSTLFVFLLHLSLCCLSLRCCLSACLSAVCLSAPAFSLSLHLCLPAVAV